MRLEKKTIEDLSRDEIHWHNSVHLGRIESVQPIERIATCLQKNRPEERAVGTGRMSRPTRWSGHRDKTHSNNLRPIRPHCLRCRTVRSHSDGKIVLEAWCGE